jgi:hypothetical protein
MEKRFLREEKRPFLAGGGVDTAGVLDAQTVLGVDGTGLARAVPCVEVPEGTRADGGRTGPATEAWTWACWRAWL